MTAEGRPVRVVHLIDSLGAGGAEQSLAELVPLLPACGVHSSVAVLIQRSEGVEDAVRASGTELHVVGRGNRAASIRSVRALLRQHRPDVLHTSLFESDVIGRLAALGTRTRVVTSLVNTSYRPERLDDPNVARWKLELVRHIDGFTARHMTRGFHSLARAVEDSAVEALGIDRSRITLVPRGRSRSRLGEWSTSRRSEVRARLGLRDDQPVVLNVARQEYQKDQATLLRAAALLRKERADLVVLVAGRTGNASEDLRRQLDDLDLGATVQLLGHRSDVGDLLVAADAFVFPSIYEGFGGSVLEAMALRAPVVASDIGPMRELLVDGQRGALVPPGEAQAFASAMGQALERGPDVEQRVELAEAAFREEYELEVVAAHMAQWFREMADATPVSSPRPPSS